MRADCVPWTIEDTDTLEKSWAEGKGKAEIGRMLKRSRNSIHARLRTLGLLVGNPEDKATDPYTPEDVALTGDIAFKQAVLRAAKSGAEKISIGVVRDRRPLVPTKFTREPISSGCGSSSEMCAEVA